MPKRNSQQQREISKQFWQYLQSKNLKPPTKLELRQIYYDDYKKSIPGSPTAAFSSVLYQLKRMKKLTKGEGGDSILYYERRGRKMVIAIDQNYVQRRRTKKEKDQIVEVPRNQAFLDDLKKAFVANKYVAKMTDDQLYIYSANQSVCQSVPSVCQSASQSESVPSVSAISPSVSQSTCQSVTLYQSFIQSVGQKLN